MAVVVNCCYISKTELNQGIDAKGHLMRNGNTRVVYQGSSVLFTFEHDE